MDRIGDESSSFEEKNLNIPSIRVLFAKDRQRVQELSKSEREAGKFFLILARADNSNFWFSILFEETKLQDLEENEDFKGGKFGIVRMDRIGAETERKDKDGMEIGGSDEESSQRSGRIEL